MSKIAKHCANNFCSIAMSIISILISIPALVGSWCWFVFRSFFKIYFWPSLIGLCCLLLFLVSHPRNLELLQRLPTRLPLVPDYLHFISIRWTDTCSRNNICYVNKYCSIYLEKMLWNQTWFSSDKVWYVFFLVAISVAVLFSLTFFSCRSFLSYYARCAACDAWLASVHTHFKFTLFIYIYMYISYF